MRVALLFALTVAAQAAAQAVPPPSPRPLRVMSLSVCTDQLVLALLPRGRITSVSWLARDPALSLMAAAARTVPVNHGLGEEVVRDRPDLVVAGTFTSTATRALLKRLGWPMIEVGPADSVAAIRAATRQVALATGTTARGEVLLARMDARLAELARHPGPPLRVAAWDGGGYSAARGTLYDVILTAAGADNITARSAGRARPDAERLLAAAPALLVQGGAPGSDLRAAGTRHPVVRRLWGTRTLIVPQADYLCGTPFVAGSVLRLRTQLRGMAAIARAPLAIETIGR